MKLVGSLSSAGRGVCIRRRAAHHQDAGPPDRPARAPQVPAHQGPARARLAARAGHALAAAARYGSGPAELEDPAVHLQLEEPQGARSHGARADTRAEMCWASMDGALCLVVFFTQGLVRAIGSVGECPPACSLMAGLRGATPWALNGPSIPLSAHAPCAPCPDHAMPRRGATIDRATPSRWTSAWRLTAVVCRRQSSTTSLLRCPRRCSLQRPRRERRSRCAPPCKRR